MHLQHAGFPLLGDAAYGDARANALALRELGAARPLLHAWRLAFDHPASGARVAAVAPPPPDLKRAVAAVAGRG